jgi:Domain of unknown function DUF302
MRTDRRSKVAEASTTRTTVAVEHVRIETSKSFLAVRTALEELLPRLNPELLASLRRGEVTELPDLSIFLIRDHGELLRTTGQPRNALQYEIGNPLTASSMTRHDLAAALYAPLRVVLYETQDGRTVFEYDRPSSLFGQFGDERVTEVGLKLDRLLNTALLKAAS